MNAIDEATNKQTEQLALYQRCKISEMVCVVECENIWRRALAKLLKEKSMKHSETASN